MNDFNSFLVQCVMFVLNKVYSKSLLSILTTTQFLQPHRLSFGRLYFRKIPVTLLSYRFKQSSGYTLFFYKKVSDASSTRLS